MKESRFSFMAPDLALKYIMMYIQKLSMTIQPKRVDKNLHSFMFRVRKDLRNFVHFLVFIGRCAAVGSQ